MRKKMYRINNFSFIIFYIFLCYLKVFNKFIVVISEIVAVVEAVVVPLRYHVPAVCANGSPLAKDIL